MRARTLVHARATAVRVLAWGALLLLLGALLLPAGAALAAVSFQATDAGGTVFPQRSLLVSGSGIAGLTARKVHILENGVPARDISVRSLQSPGANDFGVELAIDVSPFPASIERARQYALGLGANRPPEQGFGLIEADANPPVALALTKDSTSIQNALVSVPPTIARHGLNVYQAALVAVEQLAAARIRAGFVVLLTDGADHGTAATLNQLVASATAAHVRIYAVGIRSKRFTLSTLQTVARLTGGQFYNAAPSQLAGVLGSIESGLKSQFLVRYDSIQGPGRKISASIHIDGVPGADDISYVSTTLTTARFRHEQPSSAFWASSTAVLVIAVGVVLLLAAALVALLARNKRPTTARARVQEVLEASPGLALPPIERTTRGGRQFFSLAERMLAQTDWWDTFVQDVEISQLEMSAIELMVLIASVSVLLGAVLDVITGSLVLAALVFLAAPVAAWVALRQRLARTRRLFAEQLAEHLQEVAAAMRAGRSFVDALALVTEAASEPVRTEFENALADERVGLPLDQALAPIARRMESDEMTQVALVAKLDRGTGASTAEVLDRVAETVRENTEVRRELRTLTAQVRLSGWILSALPLAILVAVSVTDPNYEHPMYHTTGGILLLVLCGVMVILGTIVMRRIVRIDF